MKTKTVIKLFENCHITKGAERSLLIDMQRNDYYFIPNALAELFDKEHILRLPVEVSKEDETILKEYVRFLVEKELGFSCKESMKNLFPILDIQKWESANKISNIIAEVNFDLFNKILDVLQQLTAQYQTRYLEIHLVEPCKLSNLEEIIKALNALDIECYNIIFSVAEALEFDSITSLIKRSYKIYRTIIYNANRDEVIKPTEGNWGNIFIQRARFTYKSCGIVDWRYFTTTLEHVTESHMHNTCLNKKLTIDVDGNFKNCPNSSTPIGNIFDCSLDKILASKDLQNLWNISKDKVSICKDCEFRHICTDCRAYLEDPDDIYSKPLKCGYNPNTCEWEEWSTNPLKQKAIEYYGLNEIVKDTNAAS